MKTLKMKISDQLYGKIIGAIAVLGQDAVKTVEDFLTDSADVVLNGRYFEVDDDSKFQQLQQIVGGAV